VGSSCVATAVVADGIFLSGDTLIDSIDLFVEVRSSVLLIAILSLLFSSSHKPQFQGRGGFAMAPQFSENPGTRTKREYSLAEIYHAEQQLRTGLEPKIIGFAATG